ncbi:hypothetical protein JF531_01090 [Microbacterium esteraromaticum]|uniref:hypothetical protein n=1 Tax=Microbacterium esteraromaticum TaxID=57043 RepID=UPI001A8C1262|nr:hypothetical protein [Microbacterium esteraromaticum]MBN8423114.1 hypothetical protein [Microbacterium esteraromaticum]
MTEIPRLRLEELLIEAELTNKRHIIVEGPTDKLFVEGWSMDVSAADLVIVTDVESIEIDPGLLYMAGLNDGNRSRVLVVARHAATQGIDIRCIADRDCGHGVDEHSCDALLWTDYPSLESYAVDVATLDRANVLGFAGKLPAAADYLPGLTFALRETYCVRVHNEHLPSPDFESGFASQARDFFDFRVEESVAHDLRADIATYERPAGDDGRQFAYGHDIAGLMLAVYANVLKNQAGLRTREAVENVLRGAIQVVGSYRSEGLFSALEQWVKC